jgi:branched-chain amino acid transport system permease protein
MSDFLLAYQPLFDFFLIYSGYAFSQYIVLRAGVFSVATPGLAAIGAYTAAILTTKYGIGPWVTLPAGIVAGTIMSLILSIPLARLRGVYQAIATVAFVQILLALNLYAEDLTGGAMGIAGIPKLIDTPQLLIAVIAVGYLMHAINLTRIGRAFNAIRDDEAVAVALGVSIPFHQTLAFALSGAVAGLFGGLEALHGYALQPGQYDFDLLITILSYVVIGGRRSVWGPVVGTAVLLVLPEIARPLADYRLLVYGVIMVIGINWLPRGIVDTFLEKMRRARMARRDAELERARG